MKKLRRCVIIEKWLELHGYKRGLGNSRRYLLLQGPNGEWDRYWIGRNGAILKGRIQRDAISMTHLFDFPAMERHLQEKGIL